MFNDSLNKKIQNYEKSLKKTITNPYCMFYVVIKQNGKKASANNLLEALKETINEKVSILTQNADGTKQKKIYDAAISLIKSLHRILSDSFVMSYLDHKMQPHFFSIGLRINQDESGEHSSQIISSKVKNDFEGIVTYIFSEHKEFYIKSKRASLCIPCLCHTSSFFNPYIDWSYPHKNVHDSLSKILDKLGFETEASLLVITPQASLTDKLL
jgi:hypothetical protein